MARDSIAREPSARLRVVHAERNNRPATKENIVGMNLKTCLASMAVLVATAAHAGGAASGSLPAEADATYRSAEASAGQAAVGQQQAMALSDQHAGAGGGSGELTVDRAATSPTEKEREADWNRQEFRRNAWSTP